MAYESEKNITTATLSKITRLKGGRLLPDGMLLSPKSWDKKPDVDWNTYCRLVYGMINSVLGFNDNSEENRRLMDCFQQGRKAYFSGECGRDMNLGSNEEIIKAVGFYAAYRENHRSADVKGISL